MTLYLHCDIVTFRTAAVLLEGVENLGQQMQGHYDRSETGADWLVNWCFEPCPPLRANSGLSFTDYSILIQEEPMPKWLTLNFIRYVFNYTYYTLFSHMLIMNEFYLYKTVLMLCRLPCTALAEIHYPSWNLMQVTSYLCIGSKKNKKKYKKKSET